MSAPYIISGIRIEMPRRIDMAFSRFFRRFFSSSRRRFCSSDISALSFLERLRFSRSSNSLYSSLVRPWLLISTDLVRGMALVEPMIPLSSLNSLISTSPSFSSSSLYRYPSSKPLATTRSIYTFLSWRSIVSTSNLCIRDPSIPMTGQKFRNSAMAVRSSEEVLPALVEIFAVSASTLSVRSGAKSKT